MMDHFNGLIISSYTVGSARNTGDSTGSWSMEKAKGRRQTRWIVSVFCCVDDKGSNIMFRGIFP